MDLVKCVLLCVCHLLVGSYAGSVPFIDKCAWNDKPCLITSSQKAVPFFANGLPDLGIEPLDPLHLKTVALDEAGLKIVFSDTVLTGASKCQVKNVERNIDEKWLKFGCECPIDFVGKYEASGQVLVAPVTGNGPFHIKTDNIALDVKLDLSKAEGSDGEEHWTLGNYEYSFDIKEKALLHFENLFDGDEEKASVINTLLDQNWKELSETIGKPLVNEIIRQILEHLKTFVKKVPAKELEL